MTNDSKFKFSKTATFMFPLLGIEKQLFNCSIKTTNGYTNTRFLNAYLWDSDLDFEYNDEPYLFIAIKPYQDLKYDSFYSTIISFDNYVDEYTKGDFTIMIFRIPDENIEAYDLLMQGKYSELRAAHKSLIMKNFFHTGKPTTIPLILSKSQSLKAGWESLLSYEPMDYVAELNDQEVWSIINYDDERLSEKSLIKISNNHSLAPSSEFNEQ